SQLADALAKGYTRAVAAVLEARDKGQIKGVHGTVAELASLDRRYEAAINVAAGQRMQAVVVDSDSVAAECIEFLKKSRAGRATFLPLNKMLASRPRGKAVMLAKETLGFAIDLITFDEKYRDAFYYVFGDTLVVDTLDNARAIMGGVRLVTVGGELIEASGAMIGGESERAQVRFGGVSRGELEKVAAELRKATEQADKARTRLTALREDLQKVEGQLKEVGAATSTVEVKLDALEAMRKDFAAKVKATDEALKEKNARLAELRKTAERTAQDVERLSKQLEALRGQRDGKKKQVIDATPQQVAARMKELAAKKAELSEEFHALSAKVETLGTQLKVFGERLAEIDVKLAANRQAAEENATQIKDLTATLEEMEKEIRGLEKMTEAMGREVKDLQTGRDEAYKAKTDLEAAVDKVQQKMEAKEAMFLGLQQTLQEQEAQLRQAEAELLAVQVEVTGEVPSLETLKRTIAEAEAQINALGNVNLRALEDYDAQKARHGELTSEFKQLEVQRTDLINMVGELNGKKKEGLVKVFQAINENFKQVYAELSEGGEAELVIENEQDPLAGGLIVKAKPPHKKVLRLEALSGGEKSLVSMAFIFAIQQYDPSPFYMLDEVDQNLDAMHAEKVARMVGRNARTAQFVQISLRKVTLKEADHIIGVTMRSDSISELVMKVNLADVHEEKPSEEVAA
ncbi:MAG: chromosome segregation protein SMC, partial [Candidatus Thermoplasmatota archaeon]